MRQTAKLYIFILATCLVLSCEDRKTIQDTPRNTTAAPAQDTLTAGPQVDAFEETVYNVVKAFNNRDQKMMDSLISEKGVVVLLRTGVFNEYRRTDRINFDKPVPGQFPYPVIVANYTLKQEQLPTFSCGTMEWSKHGLYSDPNPKDTLLSGTPMNLKKYRGDNIPDSEINEFKELEKKSRRVVLADPKGDLIFYLTLTGNKWYFTVLDRITTDCSA